MLSLPIITMVAKLTVTEKSQQNLDEEPKLKAKKIKILLKWHFCRLAGANRRVDISQLRETETWTRKYSLASSLCKIEKFRLSQILNHNHISRNLGYRHLLS